MGNTLIITEKPSAGRNFAKALGGRNGKFDGIDYEILSLRGHLMELLPPVEQVSEDKIDYYKKWDTANIPWNIQDFSWRKKVKTGQDIIKDLKDRIKKDKPERIIIATDNDPSGEGELLAWEVLDHVKWTGPTQRMYFEDESEKSIIKAFKERKDIPSMNEDGDYVKAFARERWDFLSMQFTRVATCVAAKKGYRFVVREGRLKSVMVDMVGKQQDAINNYVKKPFFEIRFKDENGVSYAKEDAERTEKAEDLDVTKFHDSNIILDSSEKKKQSPGKLLDLSAMSGILAAKGLKADKMLETYQKMYEDSVVSYPRTEDKAITLEQFNDSLKYIDKVADLVGLDKTLLTHRTPRKTHVKEGLSHGANRPGTNVPTSIESLSKYGEGASDIYMLLAKNFLSMFGEDYEYEQQKGHVEDYPEYKGSTSVPISLGYKAIFDDSDEEDEEKKTGLGKTGTPYIHEGCNQKPPTPTIKWLVKQLEKYNVGTGATRTSTIAEITKAKNDTSLMTEKKGVLKLTDCGEVSYTLLKDCMIASPDVTEKLFNYMNDVGTFKIKPSQLLGSVNTLINHDKDQMMKNGQNLKQCEETGVEVIENAKCPKCGQEIHKKGKVIVCSSVKSEKQPDGTWKEVEGCGFKMYGGAAGKELDAKEITSLLNGDRVLLKGLRSKEGKKYDAYVKRSEDPKNGFYVAAFDGFPESNTEEDENLGKCPICGKGLVLKGDILTCMSNKSQKQSDGSWKDVEGCGFKLYRKSFEKTFTKAQLRRIVSGEKIEVKGLKNSKGKTFNAVFMLGEKQENGFYKLGIDKFM